MPPRSTSRLSGGERRGARLITLTSDFGLRDPYVAQMKSRILQRAPAQAILDLTHEITPFRPEEAGYWLWCVAPQFPTGTVHVAVVDPGVGGERAIVVLETQGQRFIAPDNGLLGLLSAEGPGCAYRLGPAGLERMRIAQTSATFHGRDLMAPLAAELSTGRLAPAEIGPPHTPLPGTLRAAVTAADGSVHGCVAVIDHYGNALTTLPGKALTRLGDPVVHAAGRRLRLRRAYVEADVGECVALINSAGMLELAAARASAARLLNVEPGAEVYVSEG